jgi:hypothetical protein
MLGGRLAAHKRTIWSRSTHAGTLSGASDAARPIENPSTAAPRDSMISLTN